MSRWADLAEPAAVHKDTAAVVAANFVSFTIGEGLWGSGVFGG